MVKTTSGGSSRQSPTIGSATDGDYIVDPHFTEPDIRGAVARILQFEHALRV